MALFAAAAMDVGSAVQADILYHYKIPDTMHCQAGDGVIVPFGKGNRRKTGFVLEISSMYLMKLRLCWRLKNLPAFCSEVSPEAEKLLFLKR